MCCVEDKNTQWLTISNKAFGAALRLTRRYSKLTGESLMLSTTSFRHPHGVTKAGSGSLAIARDLTRHCNARSTSALTYQNDVQVLLPITGTQTYVANPGAIT